MENTLKNVWKNISSSEKQNILDCLGKNSLCGNPNIDQYLINNNSSKILHQLNNLVGGANEIGSKEETKETVNGFVDELKEKIDKIQKDKQDLSSKVEAIQKQKTDLENKIDECNKKMKETEEVIKDLNDKNSRLQEDNKSITENVMKSLKNLINSL